MTDRSSFDLDYLAWALELSPEESELREQVLDRLPDAIVDAHAHSSPAEAIVDLSTYAWGQARSSFPSWTADQSMAVREFLYGDRVVSRRVMAHPYKGFDHKAANKYLLATTVRDERVILCGLPDNPDYTVAQLESGRYCGLKMYPAYREPPFESVVEFFPEWAMAAAAAARVPIVLHVPRPLPDCVEEVVGLAASHPDVPIVLAHLGRIAVGDDRARAAFAKVATAPNVYADTSMVIDPAVHLIALEVLGISRVLYGSDEPFNLLRYVSFRHPERGLRLMSPKRYHWLDPDMHREYRHLAQNAVLVHLQVLRSVVAAVDTLCGGDPQTVLGQVFCDNAGHLFPARAGNGPVPGLVVDS